MAYLAKGSFMHNGVHIIAGQTLDSSQVERLKDALSNLKDQGLLEEQQSGGGIAGAVRKVAELVRPDHHASEEKTQAAEEHHHRPGKKAGKR